MNLRGYIFSRPFMGERVPQHIQNIVLRNYCSSNSHKFYLSASEYTMESSFYILNQTINELSDLDGILAYSVFQMPENYNMRNKVFKKMISQNKHFFFAVEGLSISNKSDIDNVHELWEIKKQLPSSLNDFSSIKK
ncbi:sporadic carbohydrate cluster protein, LIC12192 family [bacterium]|nr:sporadic carbohydrate cluster protein, LIC12192 family [bacterium]